MLVFNNFIAVILLSVKIDSVNIGNLNDENKIKS